jgi:hypothetical protein
VTDSRSLANRRFADDGGGKRERSRSIAGISVCSGSKCFILCPYWRTGSFCQRQICRASEVIAEPAV